MSLRLPGRLTVERASSATGLQPVEHEILGEMASSLGHAGRRVEQALATLAADEPGLDAEARERRLRAVAAAVHAYFIQRELCGMRRHDDVIREMGIPRRVLARLGAR
ncbi:MAG: DUF6665 family protein [Pseudomonadota bacterium]